MNHLERAITAICQALLWASTLVIFLILSANTVLRYATGASLQWANEVPELLFPWLVTAGVVLAAQRGAHITTSFLVEKLPGQLRQGLAVLGWLTVCGLYATLALATYRMLEIVHDEKSPILQIPGSVTYACVMGGMLMLSLLALISAWHAWREAPRLPEALATPEVHW